MSWVRVDDAFLDHHKFLRVGPDAGLMALAALAWSNRNLTDGHLPRAQIARLIDLDGIIDEHHFGNAYLTPLQIAQLLADAGLWDPEPGGYCIHNYSEFQPTAAQIQAQRQKTAVRVNQWRQRNGVTNGVTNGVGTRAPNPKLTTPPVVPPKGGPTSTRKRDRQRSTRDVAAYAAEHYPDHPADPAPHAPPPALPPPPRPPGHPPRPPSHHPRPSDDPRPDRRPHQQALPRAHPRGAVV